MEVLMFSFGVFCGLFPLTKAATKFERLFQYDNVKVLNNKISEREGIDIRDCAHACAHEADCFRFYHDSAMSSCKLHSQVSSVPHRSSGKSTPGSRYYQVRLSKFCSYNTSDWCPVEEGWTKEEKAPVCFKVSKEKLTWDGAKEACQSQGGNLIVLNEPWKQTLITDRVKVLDIVTKGYPLWVGLTDAADEGKFKWVDGSVLSSDDAFWSSRQPNGNTHENCGGLVNSKLIDSACELENEFICEKLPVKT